MLKTLRIENFRCFQTFELQQLGQLNLLVGMNNSGKTSILEAIQLLTAQLNLEALREVMLGRGEYILSDEPTRNRELDITHLFYGHEVEVGNKFSIVGTTDSEPEGIAISVEQTSQLNLFEDLRDLILLVECSGQEKEVIELPLSSRESLPLDYIRRIPSRESLPLDYIRRIRRDVKYLGKKIQFVNSSSLTADKMVELFSQVVLTPEEELVTQALKTIEPKLERIATIGSEKYRYNGSRGGFVVKLTDGDQRVPIGSMGDGIWRMLGLVLAIVNVRNGVLLVDEIDTGLHFSTMSNMWKLIWETARKNNVQVFATTHSRDCWESLDSIVNSDHPSEEGITIHRIEKGKTSSVLFKERQVAIAAEKGIEVR
jgi:predicted ATPase